MEQRHMTRQLGIVNMERLTRMSCSLVGAGAIGSFTALSLAKMGVGEMEVFDDDGITDHNISNQFYPISAVGEYVTGQFKVEVLKMMVHMFSGTDIVAQNKNYSIQPLKETVIVATDTMSSRKLVWEQFKKQEQCMNYIEARMGDELGLVYTIRKTTKYKLWGKGEHAGIEDPILRIEDKEFYEHTLYSDEEAVELPCTARAIIYNILMIASLICRAYKGIANDETVPREQVFNMGHITKSSYMIRV